jgi:hypothetical protein
VLRSADRRKILAELLGSTAQEEFVFDWLVVARAVPLAVAHLEVRSEETEEDRLEAIPLVDPDLA